MLVGSGDLAVVVTRVLCTLRHCLLLQGYLSTEVSAMLCMRTMLICPDVSTVDISITQAVYVHAASVPDLAALPPGVC